MRRLHLLIPALTLCFCSLSFIANAQVYSNKVVGKKNEAYSDSLKAQEYPYALPIWGERAVKRGFNIPYSAGVSVQYFWQESDIIINNLSVGFNNNTMYNLDNIVQFKDAKTTADAITFRPDVWLFPFLNVYAILGKARASTNVGFGVFVPDSNGNRNEVFNASTKVEFNTTTFGFGMTPTIGIAGCFLALDMNMAWTDVPQLAKPARSFIFGPRLGKSFFINREKNQSFAVWTGAFRVSLKSETNGSLPLSDALDLTGIDQKLTNATTKINESQQGVDQWWTNLGTAGQKNPVNIAKHDAANAALSKAGSVINQLDEATNNIASSTVQYSMDKAPKDKWNFIIGGQYQHNKHWMLRAEYGFLGTRSQYILGMQYRFGL